MSVTPLSNNGNVKNICIFIGSRVPLGRVLTLINSAFTDYKTIKYPHAG